MRSAATPPGSQFNRSDPCRQKTPEGAPQRAHLRCARTRSIPNNACGRLITYGHCVPRETQESPGRDVSDALRLFPTGASSVRTAPTTSNNRSASSRICATSADAPRPLPKNAPSPSTRYAFTAASSLARRLPAAPAAPPPAAPPPAAPPPAAPPPAAPPPAAPPPGSLPPIRRGRPRRSDRRARSRTRGGSGPQRGDARGGRGAEHASLRTTVRTGARSWRGVAEENDGSSGSFAVPGVSPGLHDEHEVMDERLRWEMNRS